MPSVADAVAEQNARADERRSLSIRGVIVDVHHRLHRRLSAGTFVLTCSLTTFVAGGAAAQDQAAQNAAPPAAQGAAGQQLETVVVTAEKRKEDIKEVPISVSVVTGEQLQEQHVQDIDDLARRVPGLSFSNVGGEGLDKIELRGISSDSPQPTVGIYLDDVPMTTQNLVNTGATQPKFFDVDRIEVLRGPQGTLFGAGSMGGTIRFISRQPDLTTTSEHFYSEISGTEHGGLNYEVQGVANVPIVDGVAALRLGYDYTKQSGWIDHYDPFTGVKDASGINDERTQVFHASLKYQPFDGLTITPALLYQRVVQDDTDVFGNRVAGDTVVVPQFGTDKLVKESSRDQLFVPSVTVDADVGFADLTSITSYFWRMFPRVQDGTNYNTGLLASAILNADPATLAEFPNVTPAQLNQVANTPVHAFITPNTNQFTEELRLASKGTKAEGVPYTWTVGLYGSDAHLHLSDQEYTNSLDAVLQQIYGVPPAQIPAIYAPFGVPQPAYALDPNFEYGEEFGNDTKVYAIFGEFAYYFTDALKATVGARYNYARDSSHTWQGGYYIADAAEFASETSHSYAFTPKFAVTYDVSDTSSVYATASKGFRLGGANIPIPQLGCSLDFANLGIKTNPATYAPDTLWNYELGTKASLLDNRLAVNLDGYYITWKGVQQHIYLPICGYDFNENAGNAESYGSELEVRGKVAQGLVLSLTAAYTHATLTSVATGTGFSVGDKLLGTPDWQATFGAEYTHPVTDEADAFIRADWDWTGASHGSPPGLVSPDNQRPVYDVFNASAGVTFGQYEVSIFAKNLFDQNKIIQRPSLLSVNEGFTLVPMTIGVAFTADF